jgi:hypothetical protein
MTKLRLAIAAALLTGAAFPAFAADATGSQQAADTPAQNNAQAGESDVGNNAAPNMQAQDNSSTQIAMNGTDSSAGISSAPSATERKGTHLTAKQRVKADADEAETTRQLNQQAAAMAAPNRTAMR